MNWTNYLFAFYVFLLLAILVYIWTKASKGKLDDRIRTLEDKQREIIVLQNDTKEAIMVFETYMYETKENLETERKKIEYLIEKFEDMLEEQEASGGANQEQAGAEAEPYSVTIENNSEPEDTDKGDLYDEIRKLSKKGYSLDEIVKKLGISKGEAKFILGITK